MAIVVAARVAETLVETMTVGARCSHATTVSGRKRLVREGSLKRGQRDRYVQTRQSEDSVLSSRGAKARQGKYIWMGRRSAGCCGGCNVHTQPSFARSHLKTRPNGRKTPGQVSKSSNHAFAMHLRAILLTTVISQHAGHQQVTQPQDVPPLRPLSASAWTVPRHRPRRGTTSTTTCHGSRSTLRATPRNRRPGSVYSLWGLPCSYGVEPAKGLVDTSCSGLVMSMPSRSRTVVTAWTPRSTTLMTIFRRDMTWLFPNHTDNVVS